MSRSGKKAAEVKAAPEPEKAPPENAAPAPEQAPPEPADPPRPVEEGKLVYLKLSEMHPFHTFRPHPFKVRDDAKMQETVASIKANGVMVPGLARPEKDGNGYEIVAGHRRHHGCELAGLEEMPFIVREMTDHEAVQAMKDSNKQRDQTLPSELAALLELEVEDIKHQGGRLKNVAEGDIGKRSVEIVGEAHDMAASAHIPSATNCSLMKSCRSWICSSRLNSMGSAATNSRARRLSFAVSVSSTAFHRVSRSCHSAGAVAGRKTYRHPRPCLRV